MKRLLMAITACGVAAAGCAQQTLTEAWRVELESRDWFSTSTDRVRSADYNPVTDHITVVSRDTNVYTSFSLAVVDAENGDDVSTTALLHGGVGYQDFFVNKHAHADDGVAYITNLSLNTSTTKFVIYRMASENDALTTAFEGLSDDIGITTYAIRMGDTVDVVGSGVNTEIWVGTRPATSQQYNHIQLIKFTTADGLTFTPSAWLNLGNFGSNSPVYRGLSVTGTGANATIWVTDSGFDALKINPVTGATVDSIGASVLPQVTVSTQIDYFEAYGQQFVALGPGAYTDADTVANKPAYLVKVTNPASKEVVANTVSLRYGLVRNGNGTGSISFDPTRNHLITLTTNGALSAHVVSPSVTAAADWSIFE